MTTITVFAKHLRETSDVNRERRYHVYIMQSPSRRTLYIGVTSDIEKRVFQHKNHLLTGYSADNNTTRLVLLESYSAMRTAISREKQLKVWRRAKKEELITKTNPEWRDLGEDWGKKMRIDAKGRMWPLLLEQD